MKRKNRFVLDSFAVVSFFQAEKGSDKVKEILEQALFGKMAVYLSAINLGEIFYITARRLGDSHAEEMLDDIKRLPIMVENASMERILEASRIKARYPLSYADAFAVSLGLELKIPVVTGDPEFRVVESLVKILWLKR